MSCWAFLAVTCACLFGVYQALSGGFLRKRGVMLLGGPIEGRDARIAGVVSLIVWIGAWGLALYAFLKS